MFLFTSFLEEIKSFSSGLPHMYPDSAKKALDRLIRDYEARLLKENLRGDPPQPKELRIWGMVVHPCPLCGTVKQIRGELSCDCHWGAEFNTRVTNRLRCPEGRAIQWNQEVDKHVD